MDNMGPSLQPVDWKCGRDGRSAGHDMKDGGKER